LATGPSIHDEKAFFSKTRTFPLLSMATNKTTKVSWGARNLSAP
jgi:hypothetical protein